MSYFLFVYGDYQEHLFVIKNIAKMLNKVSSDDVKYQYGDAGAIFHFKSIYSVEELKNSITPSLKELSAMFFLFKNTDNITYNFQDKEIENHLMNFSDNVSENDNKSDEFKTYSYDVPLDYLEEFSQILNEYMSNSTYTDTTTEIKTEKKLSLDELLDKINENGINSLTEIEKKQLYEYSK